MDIFFSYFADVSSEIIYIFKYIYFFPRRVIGSSFLSPCTISSKKFKACKAQKFQLYSCKTRHISMSISWQMEAQRRVINYVRSQGAVADPVAQ